MGAESADNRVLHRAGSKNQLTIASCIVQEARISRQSRPASCRKQESTDNRVLHHAGSKNQLTIVSYFSPIWRGKEYFSNGNLGKFLFARCPYTGGLTFPEDTKNQLCSKRAQWNSHATVLPQIRFLQEIICEGADSYIQGVCAFFFLNLNFLGSA